MRTFITLFVLFICHIFLFSQEKSDDYPFNTKGSLGSQFDKNINYEFPIASANYKYDEEMKFSLRPNKFIGSKIEIKDVRITSVKGIPKGFNANVGVLKTPNSNFEVKFNIHGKLNHEINRKISVGLEYDYTAMGEGLVKEKEVRNFSLKTKAPYEIEKNAQENKKIKSLIAYPNPMVLNTTVTIESSVSEEIHFQVVNVLGKEVYSKHIKIIEGKNHINFNRNQLPKGIYIYRVRCGREIVSKRLIVQ